MILKRIRHYQQWCNKGVGPGINNKIVFHRSTIMDYQQSIKNLNHLKNFVRAWTECSIFFFFYSETEFKNETYCNNRTQVQKKIIDEMLRNGFPYGYISNKDTGEEILYYRDQNITVQYDLFFEKYNIFYCYDPVDKKILQQQFLQLVELLKNK